MSKTSELIATSKLPHKRDTQVFISYASEDALLATALETALQTLNSVEAPTLKIIRDIHSFHQGMSITSQVLADLESSDVLFVIYTEKLKSSHSFTGFEVGSFSTLIQQENKVHGGTTRRIVSLFFDEPPPTEAGILGIKLDVNALDRIAAPGGPPKLDASGELTKFFEELSDLVVNRRFRVLYDHKTLPADLVAAEAAGHVKVRTQIIPQLEIDLATALSKVIARNFIEQQFFLLKWPAEPKSPPTEIEDETLMAAGNADVYDIFGLSPHRNEFPWRMFVKELAEKSSTNQPFVIAAIQSAVQSAFADGPVDNDQIFMSPQKSLYRVIVTRYYVYFDGSRTMHLYFIPFLSDRLRDAEESALILLRLATNMRSKFLLRTSRFSTGVFELHRYNFAAFKGHVSDTIAYLQIMASASHNSGLDEPQNFHKFFGHDAKISNSEIALMYQSWKDQTQNLLDVAKEVHLSLVGGEAIFVKWCEALQRYLTYADPINKQMGERALVRLQQWFATGDLS